MTSVYTYIGSNVLSQAYKPNKGRLLVHSLEILFSRNGLRILLKKIVIGGGRKNTMIRRQRKDTGGMKIQVFQIVHTKNKST